MARTRSLTTWITLPCAIYVKTPAQARIAGDGNAAEFTLSVFRGGAEGGTHRPVIVDVASLAGFINVSDASIDAQNALIPGYNFPHSYGYLNVNES